MTTSKVLWINGCVPEDNAMISDLRVNLPDYRIIATTPTRKYGYCLTSDECYIEPILEPVEYLKWASEFCQNHDVSVVYPQRYRNDFALVADMFKHEDVEIVFENKGFQDRELVFAKLQSGKYKNVPEFRVVKNSTEMTDVLDEISHCGNYDLVASLTGVENAKFANVVHRRVGPDTLYKGYTNSFTQEDLRDFAWARTKLAKKFKMILMRWIPGEDIAADCMIIDGMPLVCLRKKCKVANPCIFMDIDEHYWEILYNKTIEQDVKKLAKELNPKFGFTARYRYDKPNRKLYLVDIEDKLSRDSWIHSKEIGFSMIGRAVSDAMKARQNKIFEEKFLESTDMF